MRLREIGRQNVRTDKTLTANLPKAIRLASEDTRDKGLPFARHVCAPIDGYVPVPGIPPRGGQLRVCGTGDPPHGPLKARPAGKGCELLAVYLEGLFNPSSRSFEYAGGEFWVYVSCISFRDYPVDACMGAGTDDFKREGSRYDQIRTELTIRCDARQFADCNSWQRAPLSVPQGAPEIGKASRSLSTITRQPVSEFSEWRLLS